MRTHPKQRRRRLSRPPTDFPCALPGFIAFCGIRSPPHSPFAGLSTVPFGRLLGRWKPAPLNASCYRANERLTSACVKDNSCIYNDLQALVQGSDCIAEPGDESAGAHGMQEVCGRRGPVALCREQAGFLSSQTWPGGPSSVRNRSRGGDRHNVRGDPRHCRCRMAGSNMRGR